MLYNVDTWSMQLSSRLRSGALLLEAEAAEGTPHGTQQHQKTHQRTSPDELVRRALKAIDADTRYYREVFAEAASSAPRGRKALAAAALGATASPRRSLPHRPASSPPPSHPPSL